MKQWKYSIIVVCLLFGLTVTQAQSYKEHRADDAIAQQSFDEGIQSYFKILHGANLKTQLRVNQKLAQVYYTIRQYSNSMKYYEAILQADSSKVRTISVTEACNILTMLNRLDESQELVKWATLFAQNDSMMQNQIFRNLQRSMLGIAVPVANDTLTYTIKNASFNTPYSEFWMGQFNDSTYVFVRSVANADKSALQAMFRGSRFYTYNPYTDSTKPYSDFPILYQAGPATFFQGNKEMIYTDNNLQSGGMARRTSATIKRNLQLVAATYDDHKKQWKIKNSIFKSDNSNISYLHPCLADSDKILYFASSCPGGYGGTDIYMSKWDDYGKRWGPPVNMGPTVNTSGDEIYPIIKDSTLYFSSNGHIGLGGFDIYGARISKQSYTVVDTVLINFPKPVNSKFNDYAFVLNKDNTSGYFTSDRNGGKGIDDIYSFKTTVKPDTTKGKHASNGLTDGLSASQRAAQKAAADSTRDVMIAVVKQQELSNVYFDFDKSVIKQEYLSGLNTALAEMKDPKNSNTKYLLMGSADPRGTTTYNYKLSQWRADAVKNWFMDRGISSTRLVSISRGAIHFTDAQIREMYGIKPQVQLSDSELIREAYREARRVTIKSIVHKK